MHEHALMADLTGKIQATAVQAGATRVTRVAVRLGALSHFTVEHFNEHFVDATRGTLAEGAEVVATLETEIGAQHANDVLLESIELELPELPAAERGSGPGTPAPGSSG